MGLLITHSVSVKKYSDKSKLRGERFLLTCLSKWESPGGRALIKLVNGIHSQDTESDEGLDSIRSLLCMQFRIPANGMGPPTVSGSSY